MNSSNPEHITRQDLERILQDMEELQARKVLELARRLNPKLTADDIKNPHDFPELLDPDWHYADGALTGIQSVQTAIAAHFDGKTRGASGDSSQ